MAIDGILNLRERMIVKKSLNKVGIGTRILSEQM
jgi:hypothetical protein